MDPYSVTGKYLLSAIYVVLSFLLAWVLAWLFKRRQSFRFLASNIARIVASLLGFGLLLTAAIGTLSWPLHSSRDQDVFFQLSLGGGFLLVYEYALGRLEQINGRKMP